jgi:hypothetical protein
VGCGCGGRWCQCQSTNVWLPTKHLPPIAGRCVARKATAPHALSDGWRVGGSSSAAKRSTSTNTTSTTSTTSTRPPAQDHQHHQQRASTSSATSTSTSSQQQHHHQRESTHLGVHERWEHQTRAVAQHDFLCQLKRLEVFCAAWARSERYRHRKRETHDEMEEKVTAVRAA